MNLLFKIIALNVLNIMDIIQTYYAIHLKGLEEYNLFLKELIINNYPIAVIIKLIVIAGLSLFLYAQIKKNKPYMAKIYNKSLLLVLIIYFFAVIGNLTAMIIYL